MPTITAQLASNAPFPYCWPGKRICYFTVIDGQPQQMRYRDDMRQHLLSDDPPPLYAIWPGEYRSDLFLIDDIAALRAAVGV